LGQVCRHKIHVECAKQQQLENPQDPGNFFCSQRCKDFSAGHTNPTLKELYGHMDKSAFATIIMECNSVQHFTSEQEYFNRFRDCLKAHIRIHHGDVPSFMHKWRTTPYAEMFKEAKQAKEQAMAQSSSSQPRDNDKQMQVDSEMN